MLRHLTFPILLLLCLLSSCKKDAPTTSCNESPAYKALPFDLGVAVNIQKLQGNARYRQLVTAQYNRLTAENAMKFDAIHPEHDYYNWAETDYLINFAKEHDKKIHGHTLVWHRAIPQWLDTYNGDWNLLLKEHVHQVVSRYKQQVKSWDVVNEALNEDGTLRKSLWFDKIGPSYIEQAFKAARNADPDALLFYNDYNMEHNPAKLDAAIALCDNLKAKGIKVDGIGLQMHIAAEYPLLNDIATATKKITDAGYKVHFSELDIRMNLNGNKTSFTQSDLNTHAQRCRDIFRLYNNVPEQYRFAITLWGVSDADTWLKSEYGNNDIPLLFDDQYNPKPAYCEIKQLFQ